MAERRSRVAKHRAGQSVTLGQIVWVAFLSVMVSYALFRVLIGWHDISSALIGFSAGTFSVLLAGAVSDIRGE